MAKTLQEKLTELAIENGWEVEDTKAYSPHIDSVGVTNLYRGRQQVRIWWSKAGSVVELWSRTGWDSTRAYTGTLVNRMPTAAPVKERRRIAETIIRTGLAGNGDYYYYYHA